MSSGQAWWAEKEAEKEQRDLDELKKKHAIPGDKGLINGSLQTGNK